MKHLIPLMLIQFAAGFLTAQTESQNSQVNYEAANWPTWLLDNPEKFTIDPPPSAAETQTELQTIKKRMHSNDVKKLSEIKYWNSGAPAYRWNQITPEVINLNPASYLRIPTAWVNIAIYDATILAWKEKI